MAHPHFRDRSKFEFWSCDQDGFLADAGTRSPHHGYCERSEARRSSALCRNFVLPAEYRSGSRNNPHLPCVGFSYGPRDPEFEALRAKPGGATNADLAAYALKRGVGFWSTTLPFYGAPKVIAAQWEYANEKFSAIPGITFRDGASYRFPLSPGEIEKIADPVSLGIPNLSFFGRPGPRSEGHIFFAPIIPMSGEGVFEAQRVFDKAFADMGGTAGRGFLFPQSYFPRSFVVIFTFPIEHDIEKNKP